MVNGKIFPFARNRFYCGKLLTSNDFRDEQGYFNNKRHFLNKMLFGSGVISGFKTYAVDDTTLMIESGVAIDSLGREVVLEKSVVKKLSTIDGFENVRSNKLKLYIEYAEKEINPMYALVKNDEGKEYEYNRIVEGVRLFVQDADESERIFEADERFIESKILFADENFELALKVPKFACKDFNFRVVAQLKKLSDANVDFSSEFMLHVPGFINEHGDNRIVFKINKVKLAAGKMLEFVQDIKADREFKLDELGLSEYGEIIVQNIENVQNGKDREAFDDTLKRAAWDMESLYVTVTERDYIKLLNKVPGLIIEKMNVITTYGDGLKIAVKIKSDKKLPELTSRHIEMLTNHIEKYRPIATKVSFLSPKYVPIDVSLRITAQQGFKDVEKIIYNEFEQEVDGVNGMAEFGKGVFYGELYSKIENLECVKQIESLEFFSSSEYAHKDNKDNLILAEFALGYLNRFDIEINNMMMVI